MIVAPRKCKKCEACEAMIGRLEEQHPGRIEFRRVPADSPEASAFGVVMPPMLIVDDFIAGAGNVPREDGLAKIVARQLGEGPRG